MELEAAKAIAAGMVALPALGAAIGLAMYFTSYNNAVARNPETQKMLDSKFFIVVAFIEALGIIPIGVAAAILFGG